MNAPKLREKSIEQLENELPELYREMSNLRMQTAIHGTQTKPHDHRRVRRDIARVKTILHEKKAAAL